MLTVALRVYMRKTNIALMEYIIVTSLIITIFLNSLIIKLAQWALRLSWWHKFLKEIIIYFHVHILS